MKTIFIVSVIAFNFVIVSFTKRLDLQRQVIFKYFGNCPKIINLPVIIGNFSIHQTGKSEYVTNGQFELKRDFPDGWKGKCTIVFNSEKKF